MLLLRNGWLGRGLTTVAADRPLPATGIDGKDHLEIRSALETIGEVLTRHLAHRPSMTDGRRLSPRPAAAVLPDAGPGLGMRLVRAGCASSRVRPCR